MHSDLVSFKILLVFPSASERDLLRQGAALASVPAEVVEADSAAAAERSIGGNAVDVILLDAALHRDDQAKISKAARACSARPFVIVIGRQAEGADVDGRVDKPATIDEAQSVVDRCMRMRVPRRVLIVDDSATMRGIVRKILSASRFPLEISDAHEGGKALQQLRESSFDIVFLDCNMPGLDGFEILSQMRRDHPNVTVVMITSTDDQSVAERARAAGATAFLKKPFFPADIDAVLYRFFGLEAPRRG